MVANMQTSALFPSDAKMHEFSCEEGLFPRRFVERILWTGFPGWSLRNPGLDCWDSLQLSRQARDPFRYSTKRLSLRVGLPVRL